MSLGLRRRRAVLIWSILIFLLGAGLRLFVLLEERNSAQTTCEAVNIAVSLATTGRYADAYGAGVGPTAHEAPLHPLFLAALFKVFGTQARGRLAMNVAGSLASALAFALAPALAVAAGVPAICGVVGGLAGAVLPLNMWYETTGAYDAPFTAVALILLCIFALRIRARSEFTKRSGILFGIALGLGFLLSSVLIPVAAAWVIFCIVERRRQLRHMIAFAAVTAICVIATMAPWAIRNYEVLGSLIWTRSNFWLEMHASNNDLLTANEEINLSDPQFALFHPYTGAAERAKVKRMGEVAYMRMEKSEELAWLATHKRRFLELTAERFRLFWIPEMKRRFQTILEAALTIFGLAGMVLLFQARAPSAWFFAPLFVLYPAPYYLIMVGPRFRVPVEPFFFLLAAYCAVRVAGVAAGRRRERCTPNTAFARP